MIEHLKEVHKNNEGPISKNAPRILITGCPIGGVYEKVVKPLEELGGVVVAFENCSGIKNLEELVEKVKLL